MPVVCPQPPENSQLANPAALLIATAFPSPTGANSLCALARLSALTINPARPQTYDSGSAVLLVPCSLLQTLNMTACLDSAL